MFRNRGVRQQRAIKRDILDMAEANDQAIFKNAVYCIVDEVNVRKSPVHDNFHAVDVGIVCGVKTVVLDPDFPRVTAITVGVIPDKGTVVGARTFDEGVAVQQDVAPAPDIHSIA